MVNHVTNCRNFFGSWNRPITLKRGRAAGANSLSPEYLNFLSALSIQLLKHWSQSFALSGSPTSSCDWRDGIIASVHRGLDLCLLTVKVTVQLGPLVYTGVRSRKSHCARPPCSSIDLLFRGHCRPQQSGFTQNRATLVATLVLRLLTDMQWQFRKPLHLAYVKLKAAFAWCRYTDFLC